MVQKTLITADEGELTVFLQTLREDAAYASASDRILLFSDQNDDRTHLQEQTALIKKLLPETRVVGITMPTSKILKESGDGAQAGFSALLFERSGVEVFHYNCVSMSAGDAGRRFKREIRYREHIAGIMLFSAGLEQEIDRFLTAFAAGDRSDVPILGAQAGASGRPWVCGDFPGYTDHYGITAIVFYGRSLHLFYNYDLGWRAIGKELQITGIDGNYCVTTIDGQPAVSVYSRYLGVNPDEYFVENVREFPFMTMRGDRQVVRTPSGYDRKGRLKFIARVNEGDRVHLSYGNPRRLLEDTKRYAEAMRDFEPQALFLFICENRVRFLKDLAATDIAIYQAFAPQVAWVRGFAAMMLDRLGGGIVNSAILSIGLREGASRGDDAAQFSRLPAARESGGAIPFDQRLAMFLEQTTKELEEMAVAAQAANQAKSDFLSQMSHEIRTPINAVLGMNEMILRESREANVLQYAENARLAGLNLLGIINDILDFSKIEAGKMEITPYDYELSSLVNDLVNLIWLRAEDKGLAVEVEVNPDTPHILNGDEVHIRQIVTNLLTNAVKYTEKGTVTLTIDYQETEVPEEIDLLVRVKDTGVGIKQENMQKLFLAFDRIDAEQARRIEGTGLGLNITQRLLHLMGSSLQVASTWGKGSIFSFFLRQRVADRAPIGEFKEAIRRVEKRRAARETSFVAPGARILVVDDAPMNLTVISGLLKRTRIQVDTAGSGAECIEKFGGSSYDLIFLDHRMPEMDGIETLQVLGERFAKKLARTAVVCLTANAVEGAKEMYLQAGFADYLSKPVMAHELEAMLLKYLPPDKVSIVPAEMPAGERTLSGAGVLERQTAALPAWLEKVPMLHTDKGIAYCGDTEAYLEALRIFAASIGERAKKLDAYYRARDWENYTIAIHALKSMTMSVGATELSDLAGALEDAGKTRDLGAICAGHDAFLPLYQGLAGALSGLTRHVLLVDDDKDFLLLVSRWLSKDYQVETADSGEAALRALENGLPDLVLLDYAMPKMSGIEVLAAIRENERTASVPVVFLTGTDDRESVEKAEKLSPQGFLLKSTGKAALLAGIAGFFTEG